MLVHLSSTSPYVCDINLGSIEQADRMASAPIKSSITYLEKKESLPKFSLTRTPLKLLTHDEIPMDTNSASRQPSLQPVWYTEQTIVDDNNEQQRNSMNHHHHELTHATLPTIESTSPEIEDEVIIKEVLTNQSLLMRKSSTFTIEQQPSALNDSEKENDYHTIMTSTQQPSAKPILHPAEPSDESFRALEHLLGLGSTVLTTVQESPKSNHESLSLTMVTPTELINQTAASLHISYAPQNITNLPSSQNILVMPTIESITDPSMNSTIPPPFLVDNSDMEETTSTVGTVISNQESFNFTDDEKEETPADESNFSFELNDFENNSNKSNNEIIQPPMITIRPPTSADVAFRALVKPRTSVRLSQPLKIQSPLAKSDDQTNSTASISEESSIEEEIVTESSPDIENDPITSKDQNDASSSIASCSSSFISVPKDSPAPVDLSREYSYNTPTLRTTRLSERRRSILTNNRSHTRTTHSVIPSIPEQQITTSEEEEEDESLSPFPSATLKPVLSVLSTNPTAISEGPPLILQKSLAGSASPSPNPTPIITIRKSDRLSSIVSPRRSIKPLQSSTPSMRVKSLQLVSIGEQEQVLTTAPSQKVNVNTSTHQITMCDKEQQVDIPQDRAVSHESIQTSPERRPCLVDISIQTSPSLNRSSPRSVQTTSTLIIEQENQQQVTPLNSKAMIHLRRNVRFQFTPSTDARLAAKEKLEEDEKFVKQQIPIINDNEHENETEEEIKITKTSTTFKKKETVSNESSPIENQTETINEIPQPIKKTSKRSKRHEKEPELIVINSSPVETKRANRKRSNHKSNSPSEPPIEPVHKRAKTTENKQPIRVPSPEPLSTRSRSKTPVMSNIPMESITPSEPPKKSKKNSSEVIPIENSTSNNKRKNSTATMKKSKRRLHSVEQDEGLNTADEEETIQTVSNVIDLGQEEKEKIEGLTVAELKTRLTAHGENIPKGVRKADLVALLMKIETNLLQERKQAEIIVVPVDNSTSRKTRRKK